MKLNEKSLPIHRLPDVRSRPFGWLRHDPWAKFAALALWWTTACSSPAAAPSPASEDAGQSADVAVSDAGADAVQAPDTSTPVAAPFAITQVTPPLGKSEGGELITIYGSGFVDGIAIFIGGAQLDPSKTYVLDDQALQFVTPPHESGWVDITAVLPSDPPQASTLKKAFQYYNEVAVLKVDPPQGPTSGGTAVTIRGTGFSGLQQVLVGGKPGLNPVLLGDDTVTVITPPGTFGAVPVHVIAERGTGLLAKGFFYTTSPAVTSVSPASGPTAGGNPAWVFGSGFSKDLAIQIGGASATVTEIKGTTQARVLIPAGAAGKADVTATTSSGQGVLPGGYVYTDDQGQAATQILSIAPPSGPLAGGNQVAIVATGLVASSDTTVLFGSKVAEVLAVDPPAHTVLVRAPAGLQIGSVDVALLTSKGTDKAAAGYSYSDALVVASVTPNSGPSQGGTKLIIAGSGFSQGTIAVKVGALPASAVAVVSDTEIQAITPPGTPGYADVAVIGPTGAVTLANAFSYTGGELALYVVFPPQGARAGGTLVHLYGQGFTPTTAVTFGGNPASHFVFVDPGHITVKTPPGPVGTVDVTVAADGADAYLPKGFAYFDPASSYGGTWGSAVEGSVNVTVLETPSGKPIPDAFTMLWTDPTTPYQGFTNADGQITFSGDDLVGKQMVSASKTGYQAASVVLFDAQNVTIHLSPTSPPSPGDPPPGKIPPSISGHVIGVDKYVFVPNGYCGTYAGQGPGMTCNSCSTDLQCGDGFACVDLGEADQGIPNGKRCVADCSQGQGCGAQFKCAGVGTAGFRCIPAAGEVAAFCVHTKPNLFSQNNDPPEGAGFVAESQKGYAYKIAVAPGEQATICFGGYKEFGAVLVADDPNAMVAFTPTVMGVKRHVQVAPEQQVTGIDVTLDIPLTQTANVRLDRPPTWGGGDASIVNFVQPEFVLGSDGVLRWPTVAYKFAFESLPDLITLKNLPNAFAGTIADTSLTLETFVFDLQKVSQMPRSINIKTDVRTLTDDRMIRRKPGGELASVSTGIKKNIYGLWGTDASNLYAVGALGSLWHWDGGGWTQQGNPLAAGNLKFDWRGVHGVDASTIFAVGTSGAAAVFNGTVWKAVPVANAENLSGVFATTGPNAGVTAFASSQNGLQQWSGTAWQKVPGIYSNFLAIHGSDASHIWAVGMTGALAFYDGTTWKTQASGTSIALHDVWAAGPNLAFAVGEKGVIQKWDGKNWKPMTSGVQTTLQSVWGTAADDVWAVGARGVTLHYNGKAWQKLGGQALDKLLDAVWTTSAGDLFALGEQELLITPLLYPPLDVMPKEDGVLSGNLLKWSVDASFPEPHFNWITLGIPSPMAPDNPAYDTPVWGIVQKGSATQVDLPDLPSIQGTPGIPKATTLRMIIIRGYMEGFDIDHYMESDLNAYNWQAWAEHRFTFTTN